MILEHTLEKYQDGKLLVIVLKSKEVKSLDDANELGYDDFEAHLYINNKFICDLSPVLAKSIGWEYMIDEVNWGGLYQEAMIEKREYLKAI